MTSQQYFNYLTERDATELKTIHNQAGQKLLFVEHPEHGDEHPVAVMFPSAEVAFDTTFYDTGDFYLNSEYLPILDNGKLYYAFEAGSGYVD